jgi:hypothetical protein
MDAQGVVRPAAGLLTAARIDPRVLRGIDPASTNGTFAGSERKVMTLRVPGDR